MAFYSAALVGHLIFFLLGLPVSFNQSLSVDCICDLRCVINADLEIADFIPFLVFIFILPNLFRWFHRMLRSMNSHVMYAQKGNRLVFERDVPQFLMVLYHSNLLISQWNPQTAQRFSLLPYECSKDSNGFDVVKVGNPASSSLLPDCGAEIKSRNQASNVSGKFHSTLLGPGGDTVNSVAFNVSLHAEPFSQFLCRTFRGSS